MMVTIHYSVYINVKSKFDSCKSKSMPILIRIRGGNGQMGIQSTDNLNQYQLPYNISK